MTNILNATNLAWLHHVSLTFDVLFVVYYHRCRCCSHIYPTADLDICPLSLSKYDRRYDEQYLKRQDRKRGQGKFECTSIAQGTRNEPARRQVYPESADELEAEDVWEDISHSKTLPVRPNTPTRPETPPRPSCVTFRKRKPGRAIFVVAAPRKQFIVPLTPPPPRQPRPPLISPELANDLREGAKFTMKYAKDVVHQAVRLLRMPLSVLLFLWMLAMILGRVSHTLRTAFSPLCLVPVISSSAMCSYRVSNVPGSQTPQWADYPKLVDVQSATFEQLLDQSVGGSGLALEIKKAEMATMDLVTLVRLSELTSRELLANSLVEFVGDAKKTGRGLQKLTSKIGGAVDE
jgi:hypothetical protein